MHRLLTLAAMQALTLVFSIGSVQAAVAEYDLTIIQEEISITGRAARGMTLNGSIPGPVLHFKEGDTARIQVHNKMDVEISLTFRLFE